MMHLGYDMEEELPETVEGRLASEERYLLDQLRQIQESYKRMAKPYVDRLVQLNSLRVPRLIMMINEHQKRTPRDAG